jgi:hypothetical protein
MKKQQTNTAAPAGTVIGSMESRSVVLHDVAIVIGRAVALAVDDGEMVIVVNQPGVLLGVKELVMLELVELELVELELVELELVELELVELELVELDVGAVELGIDMT